MRRVCRLWRKDLSKLHLPIELINATAMCAGMGKSISWHMFHGTSTRPEPYKYGKVDIHGAASSGFPGLITHSRRRLSIDQFFLGMANFVEWSLELRTQFIFTLFDDDRSGFLSMVRIHFSQACIAC